MPALDITQYLLDWSEGDSAAFTELVPLVYDELRRLARRHVMRNGARQVIEPTILVHESYLRLIDQTRVNWRNRAHFFAIASEIMRRVLVDHARLIHRKKRGGDAVHVTLHDNIISNEKTTLDLLALNEALDKLAAFDSSQARVIELRYFGGLSIEETAEALSISPATVKRDWASARAWLYREMYGDRPTS